LQTETFWHRHLLLPPFATGLPSGITYSVTEAEANQDGYTTASSKASGSIVNNDTVTVAFTNTKNRNISEGPKDDDKTTPAPATPAPAATATPQYTIPQTGDTSNPALLVVLMLVSGSAAIGTAVVGSKKKHNR